MKSSNLVGFMEGKEHDSGKELVGGCGSSNSSHGTAIVGIILHPFWLFLVRHQDLGSFRV